jgi:hypothetical protein
MRLGTQQSLTLGTTSLVLQNCNFNPDDLEGIGFSREYPDELQVDYNLFGNAFVRSLAYDQKYAFEWSLFVNEVERTSLEILFQAQRRAMQSRASNYAITMVDSYLPMVEPLPASRPIANLATDVVVPPSAVAYWGIFQLVFTAKPAFEWFYDGLWTCKLEAREI